MLWGISANNYMKPQFEGLYPSLESSSLPGQAALSNTYADYDGWIYVRPVTSASQNLAQLRREIIAYVPQLDTQVGGPNVTMVYFQSPFGNTSLLPNTTANVVLVFNQRVLLINSSPQVTVNANTSISANTNITANYANGNNWNQIYCSFTTPKDFLGDTTPLITLYAFGQNFAINTATSYITEYAGPYNTSNANSAYPSFANVAIPPYGQLLGNGSMGYEPFFVNNPSKLANPAFVIDPVYPVLQSISFVPNPIAPGNGTVVLTYSNPVFIRGANAISLGLLSSNSNAVTAVYSSGNGNASLIFAFANAGPFATTLNVNNSGTFAITMNTDTLFSTYNSGVSSTITGAVANAVVPLVVT